MLGKLERIRLQRRLPNLILPDRLVRRRMGPPPDRRRSFRSLVEVRPTCIVGKGVLQLRHLRGRTMAVAVGLTVRVAVAGSEPETETGRHSIRSAVFVRGASVIPRRSLERALRLASVPWLIFRWIGIEGRRPGVNLAGSQGARTRMPAFWHIPSCHPAHKAGMLRHSLVNIGIVIALDPAVDPKDEGDPKRSANADADSNDHISMVLLLGISFGVRIGRGRRVCRARASDGVGRIDLSGQLPSDTSLSVQGTGRRLDIGRQVGYSIRRDVSEPLCQQLGALPLSSGRGIGLEGVGCYVGFYKQCQLYS